MLIPFLVFAEHFCTAMTGLLFPPRQPMLVWYLLCAEWGPLNTISLGLEGAYNLLGSQTENEYETVMCGGKYNQGEICSRGPPRRGGIRR